MYTAHIFFYIFPVCVLPSLPHHASSCKVDHLYYVDFEGPMPQWFTKLPAVEWRVPSKDLWHSSLAVLCCRRGQGPKEGGNLHSRALFHPLIHIWNYRNIICILYINRYIILQFGSVHVVSWDESSLDTPGDQSQPGSSEMCRCDVMGVETKTGHADSPQGAAWAAIRSLRSISCFTLSRSNMYLSVDCT